GVPAMAVGFFALDEIADPTKKLKGRGMALAGIITGGVGTLAGLIVVPFFGGMILDVLAARQKVQKADLVSQRGPECVRNLGQLGKAFRSYHEAHGHFPAPAIYGEGGKPLLSWRVALLPYVGEKSLYNEFHLDESWDSSHNKSLLSSLPGVFDCP